MNQIYATEWINLLIEINRCREKIGCSISSAWFRGQADNNWKLEPSIFRYDRNSDIDNEKKYDKLKKEIEQKSKEWKSHLDDKKKYKKNIQTHKEKPVENILDKYHKSVDLASQAKKELAERKFLLKQFETPILGEREIFDEYVHKSGKLTNISSWEILAEMRHYGVPTRMLDWTDQFEIALYFALEKYREKVENPIWDVDFDAEIVKTLEELPMPCVWILNPYKLSKKATDRSSIWDVTWEQQYDYYKTLLIERRWPFDLPIPIYAPSRMERIKSQGGFFTVFGNNKDVLENQIIGKRDEKDNTRLCKIDISLPAAIFGLKYLISLKGMSDFSIFRDLDTLGKELNQKFKKMQHRTLTT